MRNALFALGFLLMLAGPLLQGLAGALPVGPQQRVGDVVQRIAHAVGHHVLKRRRRRLTGTLPELTREQAIDMLAEKRAKGPAPKKTTRRAPAKRKVAAGK